MTRTETHELTSDGLRARLVAGLPVTERRLQLTGVSTAVLEGGDGPPIVLLHEQGEFAARWMRMLPDLAGTHRVIAPDLPGHGASELTQGRLDAGQVMSWLDELIVQTCSSPPVLVGHMLGGAIAARFAVEHGGRLRALVLVDTFGLRGFRPAPRLALALVRYIRRPTEGSFDRLYQQCAVDLDGMRDQMDARWAPFRAYVLDRARTPGLKAALPRLMRAFALRKIPPEELARITVPTTLIWGRHDPATSLRTAQAASARYGWPLHVIDDAADDPVLEQPEATLRALRSATTHDSPRPAGETARGGSAGKEADMTQDNITIIRRLTQDGFVGGNIDVVDDLVAEDCVDHDPLPAQAQGREGQKQSCRMVVNGLSDRRTIQDDFLTVGDKVIESWVFQGTHTGEFMAVPATGRQVQIRGIEIWRCANGKIVERWGAIDTGAVMAQLAAIPTK